MTTGKFTKNIGLLGLIFVGMTCMIGSGWLFGAYKAAKMAGPGAVYAWLIGGAAILCIALTYVELGSMLPKTGGMARYMDYTHGPLGGFLTAWSNWLAIVTVIPVEAVASIQYLSSWPWHWAQTLFNTQTGALSVSGLVLASLLIVFYFLINYWSVRLFIRFVVFITAVKIIVPLLTIVWLTYTAFHPSNFISYGNTHIPYGWAGIFTAVSTSGIIFAFHGFQSIINLSGEAKNPGRNVPLAIILSILFVLLIYFLLQLTFIGSLSPADIKNGWHNIMFSSPYAQLAIALNLHILVLSLYLDAFISPSGTAVTYMATTTRMLYGMGRNGHMPKFMTFLDPRYHIPRKALLTNLLVSFLFLWLFRGWEYLVPVVSLTGVISYLTGPIAATALRNLAPDYHRPVRVPGLGVIAPIAFIIISWLLYWAHWPLTAKVIFIVIIGLFIYAYYQTKQGWPDFKRQIKSGIWVIVYLFSIAALSYLGSKQFGGKGIIPYGWDMVCVAIDALLFYWWGIKSAWLTPLLINLVGSEPNRKLDLQYNLKPLATLEKNH